MIDAKKTGAFIAECRKENQWTQKQLGEKLGVTDRAVSKWETGRSLPDISLIEPLCGAFEISVSEFLAGKKIRQGEYKKETEDLLIRTIGQSQLCGFQIVIHLLTFLAVLAFCAPFLLEEERWLPGFDLIHVLFWMAAAALTGIVWYLDRNLPVRKYRSSNVWIEGIAGAGFFCTLMAVNFHNAGGIKAVGSVPAVDKLVVSAVFAAGFVIVVVVRVIVSRTRREEWEREKEERQK